MKAIGYTRMEGRNNKTEYKYTIRFHKSRSWFVEDQHNRQTSGKIDQETEKREGTNKTY